MATPPPTTQPLDLRLIFEVPIRQFVPWLGMVILVSLAGYPGVVCVTPMAWLMALRVGNICVARSRSTASSCRLTEAVLAGALFGFLQGILFGIMVTFLGPIEPDERLRTVILVSIMIIMGIVAGASLSWFTAYLNERRRPT